jgi:hypothetical protein
MRKNINKKLLFTAVQIMTLFFLLLTSNIIVADSNCADKTWIDGEWYNAGDKVEFNSSIYVAIYDNPGYEPTISTWFWNESSANDGVCHNEELVARSVSSEDDCGTEWSSANLTTYSSYPDKKESGCKTADSCPWMGEFKGVAEKKSESWVKQHNIIAVHSRDFEWLNGKTLKIRQGSKEIKATVYDECADIDCNGCCTTNLGSEDFLIDIEKNTMERFGSYYGTVEWQICE